MQPIHRVSEAPAMEHLQKTIWVNGLPILAVLVFIMVGGLWNGRVGLLSAAVLGFIAIWLANRFGFWPIVFRP